MNERTFVILKQDVVLRGLIGEIVTRFERAGLKVVALEMMKPSKEMLEQHYYKDEEWKIRKGKGVIQNKNLPEDTDPLKAGQDILDGVIEDMMASPVIAMILEGHNAVKVVKKLTGPTNIEEAPPGTIRGDYSHDTIHLANNLNRPLITIIHATDDPEEAEKEINFWFPKDKIFSYQKPEEVVHYRKRD